MDEHTYRRFPEHVCVIRRLALENEPFRSALADYEEMCTWLASLDRTSPVSTQEIETAQQVIRDLEAEISNHLKQRQERTGS